MNDSSAIFNGCQISHSIKSKMTPKQSERLRKKIADIRRTLAAEKRIFGVYDDSRGLRYLPTGFYVKLQDFSGGLTYTKWFQNNFPDDIGFPVFLFEWIVILFKTNKLKDAEKRAFKTFCSNTYLMDKFFGKPIIQIDKSEGSNWEQPGLVNSFPYSSQQPELADFAAWLQEFIRSEKFIRLSTKYIDVQKRLRVEDDQETRGYLIRHAHQLVDEI